MKVIDERMKNWDSEKMLENGPKDLLGLMIQASMKESMKRTMTTGFNSVLSPPITVHDIAEECKSFFFAGEQTTSNLLTWTTVLLAMHPQWQVLARDEVLKVCGPHDIPTKDDVSKLKMVTPPSLPFSSNSDTYHFLFFLKICLSSWFSFSYSFAMFCHIVYENLRKCPRKIFDLFDLLPNNGNIWYDDTLFSSITNSIIG